MKTCKICKRDKPLWEFYENASTYDGRRSRCKECENGERARKADSDAEQHKICNGCGQLLPRPEFGVRKTSKDGLRSRCKKCNADDSKYWRKNNPAKYQITIAATAKRNRELYASDPDYRKAQLAHARKYRLALPPEIRSQQGWRNHVVTYHGISWDDYCKWVDKHDGRCDCCRKEKKRLEIDHDHDTKVIRGLLCRSCNSGLGLLGDNITGIRLVTKYLKRPSPFFMKRCNSSIP